MTEALTPPSQATVTATAVADHLAKELGGKASHWSIWLANDRKPGRVNCRLPQEPGPGRPRYNAAKVDAFVIEYKQEQSQTSQTNNRPGSSKNRRFTPHISALTLAEGADQVGVLFVVTKPLASFILSADEARNIARRLINAAEEIDQEKSQERLAPR
jgi:hypothetical protein